VVQLPVANIRVCLQSQQTQMRQSSCPGISQYTNRLLIVTSSEKCLTLGECGLVKKTKSTVVFHSIWQVTCHRQPKSAELSQCHRPRSLLPKTQLKSQFFLGKKLHSQCQKVPKIFRLPKFRSGHGSQPDLPIVLLAKMRQVANLAIARWHVPLATSGAWRRGGN
jgi:hypothetical protein